METLISWETRDFKVGPGGQQNSLSLWHCPGQLTGSKMAILYLLVPWHC